MTEDLGLAQKYVPFKVIVPSYLPIGFKPAPTFFIYSYYSPPHTDVETYFTYAATGEVGLQVRQTDKPLVPLDPEEDPHVQVVEVSGVPVSFYEVKTPIGPLIEGQFRHSDTFFAIGRYNLSRAELVKTTESMLNQ